MKRSYIGITDFMRFEQIERMLAVYKANRQTDSKRLLHVGVMMSYKTLYGIKSKWTRAFPPNESIAEIFSSNETMNCLHFADYDNMPDLSVSLISAIKFCGCGINALQLDMVWPDPYQIEKAIRSINKEIDIILQVGKNAFEEANNDPEEIIDRVKRYLGIIDYMLLDKSMGRGVGMDANSLIPFIQALKKECPELGIAVAGGLGPHTMHLAEPIINIYPDISIDAQGRLRPSGNALDPIDWAIAEKYLIKALQLFKD
jgi:hypothetical protein